MTKLVYIANARLPTEKAHGYQICKMCEAFALNGVKVKLLHPYRLQNDPKLKRRTVFDYYGIPSIFEAKTLPNLDVVLLNRIIPDRWFTPFFFTHAVLWGLYATFVCHREKANLYYTRESAVAYWLVKFGLPTVYEAHVVPKGGQKWLLRWIARSPHLLLVVVLTTFIKQRFVEIGFPAEKVIVLPDGVDLSLFEDLPGKAECRHQLGLPNNRHIIGYIGRFRTLEMEKGIPQLIEAMALLPKLNGRDSLLLCVGGPMDVVPGYLDFARHIGLPEFRLRFVDRVPNPEVPYWIRACDVVTIPWQWTEHFAYFASPLKLFEYMAAGVPIVASDLPSIREVLRHGENAWLVEPGSPKSLAEGIQTLLLQPELSRQLAERAKDEARNYTWRKRAQRILEALALK